jgi:hypothetical protein
LHAVGFGFCPKLTSFFPQPFERVRFVWGRSQVALAGVTAAVLAVASAGTKTLVLSCKELE